MRRTLKMMQPIKNFRILSLFFYSLDVFYGRQISIVVLGDINVGKTNIVRRLAEDKFNDVCCHTIGVDSITKDIKYLNNSIKFCYKDLSGNTERIDFNKMYANNADILFFIYDITNKESFDNIKNIWIKLSNNEKSFRFLIGNKKDLKDNRKVSFENGASFANEHDMSFFEVSAKNKEGLHDIKELLINHYFKKAKNDRRSLIARICDFDLKTNKPF